MTAEKARVVTYVGHPEDDYNSIKVECRACGREWGWRAETPTGLDRLDDLADRHNVEVHGYRRVVYSPGVSSSGGGRP